MKTLTILFSLYLLSGCTVGQYASGVIRNYCDLPESGRKAARSAVALAVAPNKVVVECANDNTAPN